MVEGAGQANCRLRLQPLREIPFTEFRVLQVCAAVVVHFIKPAVHCPYPVIAPVVACPPGLARLAVPEPGIMPELRHFQHGVILTVQLKAYRLFDALFGCYFYFPPEETFRHIT